MARKFFKVTKEVVAVYSLFVRAEDQDAAERIASEVELDDWNWEHGDTTLEDANPCPILKGTEFWLLDGDDLFCENYNPEIDYDTPDVYYPGPEPGDVPCIGLSDDAEALCSVYGPDDY